MTEKSRTGGLPRRRSIPHKDRRQDVIDEVHDAEVNAAAIVRHEQVQQDREESAYDRFERLAEEFYGETGIMAPGKDEAMRNPATLSPRERMSAWRAWLSKVPKVHKEPKEHRRSGRRKGR